MILEIAALQQLADGTRETLREDGEFVLYRDRRRSSMNAPVHSTLVVAPLREHTAPRSLRRMEHEYSLRAELDPAWAVRPLALSAHQGRSVLVLEDPGGEPLDRLVGTPTELLPFLRLAIGLSAALGRVHQHGLIHKDIKPANALVKPETGQVWLMGFGIASRLPRERQSPEPPEFIAGTLAYMAPEQTGRMNRSIDSRSDLYSLGVTLYQMLTGGLPFTASDPMEWVHCHIARQPVPPRERLTEVPTTISAIILKLLAKTAEERYQTAAGVEADLRRCLVEREARGRILSFPLGTHDSSDRLLMPEKLYGREREIESLLASFDRVVRSGTSELVLVSGYSGIGKSAVVNELHKVLVPRGLFAAGKFDQYKRDIPYSTLAQAFQSLVRPFLSKSDAELSGWRDALLEALCPNGRLIVDLVPELKHIIGEQPPVPELPPQDAQRRFQLVFRRFIGIFARPEHPLALFLDDLQWLDAATLDLLGDLLIRSDLQHLMLIGAYRDNEVTHAHPLMRKLEAVKSAGGKVAEITLAPLTREHLGQLIADALRSERAAPLAQLVHEKTGGNPFFAIQFLSSLAEERMLTFDHDAARWSWDVDRIHAKGYTDNVVDLMVGKLTRLPAETQNALQQLACVGNIAGTRTLSIVFGTSEEQVHTALWPAVRQEFLERPAGSYRFTHDRIQEAAYSVIPEASRGEAHLRIGRLFAAHTPPEEREEAIFEIVNQLNRGAALITSQEEREQLAEFNLLAGKRAKASTAYASAQTYLTTGAALLGEDSWERRHELTFALELNQAECEFLTGALAAAEDRLLLLSRRASGLADLASVTCLRVELFTTLDRSDRAVEVGLEYLRRIGVQWSPHPSNDDVTQEYERIWRQLGSRSIEELIDLPKITDPDWCATLDVLTIVISPAMFTDENLRNLIVGRITNLSLEHGNSDGSCFAYVWLGMILGPHFGDYRAGFRFGRLGYDLVEKRGLHRYQARAYVAFGNLVMPWTKHIQSGRDLVRRAFDTANKMGDLTFAAYCCNNLNTNLLATGDPLGDVQREAENGLEFARKARFGLVIDIITTQLGLIRTLRGGTPEFGSFNDNEVDEQRFEHHLQNDPRLALPECWYWIRKLQARVYSADYVSAIKAASKAQELLWTSPSFFEMAEYHFYGALARAAHYDEASADERHRHLEALSAHHMQLDVWAQNCPENFANRAALVAAEIARIEGRDLDAMQFYEEAIRSARANDFVHNEALANELAGRFYAARGFQKIAHVYLHDARYCYLRWGADGKVRQLDQLYPHIREGEPAPGPTSTIGAPTDNLDLVTVIKVSQAVSGEIVLEKVIDTLMRTALEHAGAQRGILIVPHGGALRVEAEATTNGDTITVQSRQPSVSAADLPDSVLHYVVRTQESVILDDASAQSAFAADAYIRRNRVRSVLCLPLIRQTALIGVLYLENNLTPRVFTPSRSAVLKLIASQAAISLENAYLYTDLQQENSDRRRAEDSLRRSETYLAEAQTLSHTGSFGWNAATGKIYWSAETFRIFELDLADSPDIARIVQQTHPEDRAFLEQVLDRARREKKDFDLKHRLLMPDGSIKHLEVVARALAHESGDLEFVGAVMDITQRKRAEEVQRVQEREREEMQRQLQQASKMEAIGRLAGGIAHDFNNILGAILGYGELVQLKLGEGSNVRRQIDQVMQAGARGKGLVDRILAFSRSGMGVRVPLHVQSIVEETLELLAASLPADVRIQRKLDAADTAVMGDATQFHQVAMNLCTNAVQAMAQGGELTVVLDRVALGERSLLSHGTLGAGRYVRLLVSDTGSGIPPAVLERMFDPFFTTKRVGDGTGLGLAMVQGIVADLGGAIDVATQVGLGTTFAIWLPDADEAPRLLAEPAGEVPRGHGELVMIVDDERALVAVAEETLAQLGYEPVGFDSSVAALQAFRAEPKRFDLVLTDETMPDLTGTELAREIRQLRPDISIILMSGYSGTQLSERAQAAGVIDVLRKPLVRRDIAEPVARALHARNY
ncbi:MAG: hypothetical protein JWM63_2391 [Gammaproteobacteria bacterium]|nr:hypothetical protein [Gammaproteobacteria bacterium]